MKVKKVLEDKSPNSEKQKLVAKKWASVYPRKFSLSRDNGDETILKKTLTTVGKQSLHKSQFTDKYRHKKNEAQLESNQISSRPVKRATEKNTFLRYNSGLSVELVNVQPNNCHGATISATSNYSNRFSTQMEQCSSPRYHLRLRNRRITIAGSWNSENTATSRYSDLCINEHTRQNKRSRSKDRRRHMSEKFRLGNTSCDTRNVAKPAHHFTPYCTKKLNKFVQKTSSSFSKGHVCQRCFNRFSTKMFLEKHTCMNAIMWSFERGDFLCSFCGFRFSWSNELILHEKSHQILVQPPPLKLTDVDADKRLVSWIRRLEEKRHVDEVTPHWCSGCNENCFNLKAKAQHDVSHSLKRSFTCPFCSERFSEMFFLFLHIRLHKKASELNLEIG